jgi:hypothetical protein
LLTAGTLVCIAGPLWHSRRPQEVPAKHTRRAFAIGNRGREGRRHRVPVCPPGLPIRRRREVTRRCVATARPILCGIGTQLPSRCARSSCPSAFRWTVGDSGYARLIGYDIVSKWCPVTWEAFLDYRLRSQAFSRLEMEILREINGNRVASARQLAENYGWLDAGPEGLKHNREREECRRKLIDLGLPVPWDEAHS